ncbi:MAG TPA: tRNA (adenosine(37)-N6)-threonylcarbamoyltransferase complex transferase subunit TsaD [Candidatus Saccharimonadales bacterium]|jgi:N6-L-threonylcarbamoyladenine synthase
MKVLGIETSCDENSVAVVEDGQKLLSNVIFSQVDLHRVYGGVVPEVAARSHIEVMTPTIDEALTQAGARWAEIDAIAVAHGPGLGGSLLIGTLAARTLAVIKDKPLYGVHHALGHIYANFIDWTSPNETWTEPQFPLLALVVSGGHSHLVLMQSHSDYRLLGQTQDDAVGEAFDKVAKVLGLEYPGGPSIEAAAKHGNPYAFDFPKAKRRAQRLDGVREKIEQRKEPSRADGNRAAQVLTTQSAKSAGGASGSATRQDSAALGLGPYDYSFSGLKTAVLRTVQDIAGVDYDFPSFKLKDKLTGAQVKDVAASFQRVAAATLVDTLLLAYEEFQPKSVVIAGGVAANQELRSQLKHRLPIDINYAPISLCTDNGAMIAALGYFAAQNRQADNPLTLEIQPSLSLSNR